MSFSKENYELYKSGFKAQAERIRKLEKELRELRSLKEVKDES